MNNSVKYSKDSGIIYPIRYSIYDTTLNDTTIYRKSRKDYLKSEMVNVDFMYVQDNNQNEFVTQICHIEL